MKTSFKTSNNMLYGIIGILLSLVLVIGLIPVWSMRVDASPVGTPIITVDDLKHIENGSYYLENDVGTDTKDFWQILNNKNITLDLNGKTIKNIRINLYGAQSSLTLNDSVGTGKIDNNNVDGPTIYIYNQNTFIMNNGTLCNNNYGCVKNDGGEFIMNGGSISENTCDYEGAGVYNIGSFTMNGGTISKNTCNDKGAGVYNEGSFTMNGGSILKNKSQKGGGVCNTGYGTFIMNNGSIDNNNANFYGGGGIYNDYSGAITMNGGSVTNNTSYNGGGIELKKGTFTMNGGNISDNNVSHSGGGIYVVYDSEVTINNGTINNNIGDVNGAEDIFSAENNTVFNISNSPNIGVMRFHVNNNTHSWITLSNPLTNTTPIGIDLDANSTVPFTFTKKSDGGPNPSDYVYNFKSVNPNYGIGIDGNELKLDTAAPEPTISLTPVDIEGQYGYDIRVPLSVEVTTVGNSEITGYQWYKNTTDSNIGGTPIAGATESTYRIPDGFDVGEYYYYCMVKTRSTDKNVFRQDPSNVGTLIVSKGDARYTTDVTAKNGLTEEKTPQELVNPGATNFGEIQYALGDNDTTAPTTGWSTSIPTGTNAGLYHVWYKVAGTSNYNGIEPKCINVTINYKPGSYPSIPVTPGKIKNITGSKDAYQESNIYNTIIENEDELATLLDITDEDKAQGVNVWFDVVDATDSTLDADKAIIDAAKGDYQVGNYLTINVYKKVGNGFSYSKVKETNGKVKMKLTFSDSLKKQGRSFAIVGVHNLKGTLIGGSYNYDANTFSFANNEFSPYALVYKDEVNPQAPVSVVTTKVSAVPKTRIK